MEIFQSLPTTRSIRLFTSCILIVAGLHGHAQNISNESNIFIPSGLEVYTSGSLTNTGFFQNNGSFFLGGHWTNTAVYQGLGLVSLQGFNQTITNNNQSIEQLSINGGGTKALGGNLKINRQLNFINGVILVVDDDTLTLSSSCEVRDASSISYVDGALITEGTGYKFFPVGKNGKYHPVELLDVTGISPRIEIEVQENLPAIQSSVPSTPIADIYWSRKIILGMYEGSPVTVRYNLREGIAPDHLVMLEGESLTQEFITRETTLQKINNLDMIESLNTPAGNIMALAELPVEPARHYYFSTTLSPNASNPENRAIKIFGDNVTASNFRFLVFNRWGLVVFESSSPTHMTSQGWDGKHNGDTLHSGVYPYSLTYVDSSEKVIKHTGFITIIQ